MHLTSSLLTVALLTSAADPAPASGASVPSAALAPPASIVPSREPAFELAGASFVITGGALWTIGMLTPLTPAEPGSPYGDAPGGLAVSLSVGGLALAAIGGCLIWIAGELSRWSPGDVQVSSSLTPGPERTRWTLELRFP